MNACGLTCGFSVGAEGLEPPTFALWGDRSKQVRGLTSEHVVTLRTSEYLSVHLTRGAVEVHWGASTAFAEPASGASYSRAIC